MEGLNIGVLAAILTTAAFLPQAYKTIKTRQTKDLSLVTFSMICIGTICWCIHGFIIRDNPLIFANGLTAILSGIIVIIKLNSMMKKNEK